MKRLSKRLFFTLCYLSFSAVLLAQTDDNTERLWYDKPASIWLEALPIGNGRLGGMVYGGTQVDEIQLNEDSFWSGGPHNNNSTTSAKYLEQVRNLIFSGKEQDAEDLINKQFVKGPHGMKYLTLGSLKLTHTGITSSKVKNYERELDLRTALSTVTFDHDGHHYRRTVFASMPDSIIVMRMEADTLSNFTLRHSCTFSTTYSKTADCAIATVSGVDHIVTTEDHAITRSDIIGVLFDRDAVMICNVVSRFLPRFLHFPYRAVVTESYCLSGFYQNQNDTY